MHLVLIETGANQRYIFSSNKLRENIGASELTYRVGTEYVLDAVAKETGSLSAFVTDSSKMRDWILGQKPLEDNRQNKVEVIIATSGKAILLVDETKTGESIIRYVTLRALKEAPGLTVHGAISDSFQNLDGVHGKIKQIHERLESVRYALPSADQRFLRLPYVAPCKSTDLPANEYDNGGPEPAPRSVVAVRKRQIADKAITRMSEPGMASSIDDLEKKFKDLKWLAVIHADGNGIGEIFLYFEKHAFSDNEKPTGREYLNRYRRFSLALDICTVNAFKHAADQLQKRLKKKHKYVPLVPLVLGGDDLTVICNGEYAIQFTHDFITQFEVETGKEHLERIIPRVAQNLPKEKRLSMCAGIAIIKPHFPFHSAYDLSVDLLASAKEVKERASGYSALDYHVLYDSSGVDLDLIRGKLTMHDKDGTTTQLYCKPYLVSSGPDSVLDKDDWSKKRLWSELSKRVAAMKKTDEDEGRKALPSSMLHDIRESLFRGHAIADAQMGLVRERYADQGFKNLLVKDNNDNTLFWDDTKNDKEKTTYETNFLDALEIVEFWQQEEKKEAKP